MENPVKVSLSELLTPRELACIAKIHKESPSHLFARRVAEEIIRPVLSRIEQAAGTQVLPLYLAYYLQYLFGHRV